MFTVLIAEKEHISAIRQENKLFFEPFLENKELAFCEWDTTAQTLSDAVPDLVETVGRRKNWRAVIINNPTPERQKMRNPFDVVDYSAVTSLVAPAGQPERADKSDKDSGFDAQAWENWNNAWTTYFSDLSAAKEAVYRGALDNPLQKLTTWLCFKPEDYILNEVQEKQDVHDWAIEQLHRDEIKASLRLEVMERDQYKKDLRLKENIRRAFVEGNYLTVAYPTEVHCITTRTADNNFFDPNSFWTVHRENEYSTFADRNMYFDKMRFLVFDLFPKKHRDFRTDYIRFLATVLIFTTNPTPGSAMQARRLYQLEVDTDDTPLCTLVTSYDRKLAATAEVIENEMDKIRGEIPGELSDKAAEALFCTPADIPVSLDQSCDLDKVYVEKDYGLFYDVPDDEHHKWNRDYRTSEKALTYIVKQQSRSVRKSVTQANFSSEVSNVDIRRLTPLQIDDIRDYTDAAEDEMIASIPPDPNDASGYIQRMDKASEDVKKVIRQRMTQKTVFVLGSICLGLYLLCFLPFLFSNLSTPKTVTTAVILSAVMMGVLAAIMFVCLMFLRSKLVNAVKAYNNTVKEIMNDIQASLKRFSKYLSAACNVRRGHAVQNFSKKNLDEYTKSLRIRKKHLEDIRKRRAYLAEEYRDYFADRSFCDETMSRPYDYDFDLKKEYPYPAPFLAGDCRQIEFMSTGNFVSVPSSYVTKIMVRMEGIYE